MTSSPEDYEKLLAQIEAATGSTVPPLTPAKKGAPPAVQDSAGGSAGGRLAFALMAGVGLGIGGWVVGLLMPFLGAVSMGAGAAGAAFITALIAGPPRWFSS